VIARPVLRYHGGKWKLAPWVISHFPPHLTYVEAFGGAASVLLQKPRVGGEVYNDLDLDVVNVFRVLRDPDLAAQLQHRLLLTPFSREDLSAAYLPASDLVDGAAKMIVRSFFGFGSASMTRMHVTGFRSSNKRSRGFSTTPAVEWSDWPYSIPLFVDRFRGVVVENRDAVEVMTQHDAPSTLHYCDPPYVQSSRSSLVGRTGSRGHFYRCDMDDAGHERLAACLAGLKGMVIVSGYRTPLYERLYGGWTAVETQTFADGARPRTEVLWLNPAALAAQRQVSLL